MRNGKDEEPLERFPGQEIIQGIPQVERNKNTKIRDMQSTELGVLLVSQVVESGANIELNCWLKRNEKQLLPL